MLIKSIKVCNFKSFDEAEIKLDRFNVLVGANASGKSNLINIIKFFKDIIENGLDNAISMQGGVEYIRNLNIGASKNLSLELHIDFKDKTSRRMGFLEQDERLIGMFVYDLIYKFSISFPKTTRRYKVIEEKLLAKCDFVELIEIDKEKNKKPKKIGDGEISLIRDGKGKIKWELNTNSNVPMKLSELIPKFLEEKLSQRELFIETSIFLPFLSLRIHELTDISIYDFDPKLLKKSTLITGKTELEPNGSNLAIVLKKILDDRKNKREMSSLVKDILPFIDDIGVEKLPDRSLLANLKEIYSEKEFLPAPLMSDGTVNITALIIALYFEKKPLIIIEEPERNIHPYLISKVVDMMKDVSERLGKQIIVTTHNPEMVKYAGIDNILLVSRDADGFSKICRPSEKEEVKTFLEHDMGIEELYVQNLLEW
jgi:predicted ATPase